MSRHAAAPVAMIEAAAVGVPTIGTSVGHVVDWAPDAAMTVPVADPAALAAGIRHLLDNEHRRMETARAAHGRSLREDADWTCAPFAALYREILDRG